MDLTTVTSYRHARERGDLRLVPGEAVVAGGTWVFSTPQPSTTGLVDLTTLGWPAWETPGSGLPDGLPEGLPEGVALRVAATCTVTQVQDAPWSSEVASLVRSCAEAFLMSFKIQRLATVGGNLCLALPAGAMISLFAALGAEVVVWTPDGDERRESVESFVRGPGRTSLAPGEVVRALDVPDHGAARFAFRRTSLAALGRSASVVVGRLDRDVVRLVVTAATPRPLVLSVGPDDDPAALLGAVDHWYDDPHGAPDWRAAVTATLAAQVCAELRAEAVG
ncbi:FAD binding domain-containing protein [Nocardioides plantarum]|uniref:FAD binding domain-containing protein n=1 Tax=Nocardioides plantarum TaxID=29299 RepID=A0ABV5K684_9ACTN|nr:FAD binding domain-containing protein [Nocardioides plantarum]